MFSSKEVHFFQQQDKIQDLSASGKASKPLKSSENNYIGKTYFKVLRTKVLTYKCTKKLQEYYISGA
jgi:hypothetical protein